MPFVSKLILFISLWFLLLPAFTQDLDSLTTLFESIPGDSGDEIEQLNIIAKQYARSYPSIAEQFANKALQQSKRLGLREKEAEAHLNISRVHRTKSDLTKALEHGFNAYYIYEELADSVGMAIAANSIGNYYKDLREVDSSFRFFRLSLQVNNGDLETKGVSFNNIGSVFIDISQFDSAEIYYQKALDIREEIKDYKGLGITYGNLGIVYLERDNDPGKAKAFYEKSIQMKEEVGDFFQLAFTYINMGNLHRNIGKYAEAREYYQTAVDYAESAQAKGVKASVYSRWARSERMAGNERLAREYERLNSRYYIEVLEERQKTELEQLQASYNLLKKEQELVINQQCIELLEKDQRILLIQLVGLALLAIFLIVLYVVQRSKSRKEKELQELKHARLQNELEHKNNELSSFTLNFIQKQEMMDQLNTIVKTVKNESSIEKMKSKIKDLNHVIANQSRNDKEWENFRIYFEKVHTNFFNSLKGKFPDLSITDLRLAALIKLKLTIKETAAVLGIAPDSVKTARYRLRSKLNLDHEQNLFDFLASFS